MFLGSSREIVRVKKGLSLFSEFKENIKVEANKARLRIEGNSVLFLLTVRKVYKGVFLEPRLVSERTKP